MIDPLQYAPVLNLVILKERGGQFSSESEAEILLTVRDPDINVHHPNVVSTPTQRIPLSVFEEIIPQSQHSLEFSEDANYPLHGEFVDNGPASGRNAIIYAAESLLAQKLGISEAALPRLETRRFKARPSWLQLGCAMYGTLDSSEPKQEPIAMLTILVEVSENFIFPTKTSSYRDIFWTKVSSFMESFETRNPYCSNPALNAYEFCIHGLCVGSAYQFLKHESANTIINR